MSHRSLFLLTLLAALTGCSSTRSSYFAPTRTRAGVVTEKPKPLMVPCDTKQFIPVELQGQEIRIASEARMVEEEPIEGVAVASLKVRVWLYNYSKCHIELRPKEFYILDDVGRRFDLSLARQDGRDTGVVIAKAPCRSAVDLVYRLPAGYDAAAPRSFRLHWGFRIDETEYRHETIFERASDRSFRDPFLSYAQRQS